MPNTFLRELRQSSTKDQAILAILSSILFILVCGSLYLASSVFIPIVLSLLAYLSLRPFVAKLCRRQVPRLIASIIVIGCVVGSVVGTGVLLYNPIQSWLSKAPQSIAKIQDNFRAFRGPLSMLDRAEEQLEEAAESTTANQGNTQTVTVEVDKPKILDRDLLVNSTGRYLAVALTVLVVTFFLLTTGDDLLNRLLYVLHDEHQRGSLLQTIGEVQDAVGRYLGQITLINTGLAIVVTLVMWLVGMPTPLLWGVMAGLFNYMPYVGPMISTVIVLFAATSYFASSSYAFFAAFCYYACTAIEGQFITPALVGRALRIGPVVVLVSMIIWGFLWGLVGIFVAVPMLLVVRNICKHFDATYPVAVMLGEDARVERLMQDSPNYVDDETELGKPAFSDDEDAA